MRLPLRPAILLLVGLAALAPLAALATLGGPVLSWPAAAMPHASREYMAPNLDVVAWFHQSAADSEWLLSEHRSEIAGGGLIGTTSSVWASDGRLVATGGAQLMCLPGAELAG